MFTKWKVNLNCISTGFPCGEDGSFIIVWSTGCPPHDRPQLPAHKSHFIPATLLKSQDKSPISTAAALAYCADNHREISGTKRSGTLQHPKLCSGTPGSVKLRVRPAVASNRRRNFLLLKVNVDKFNNTSGRNHQLERTVSYQKNEYIIYIYIFIMSKELIVGLK